MGGRILRLERRVRQQREPILGFNDLGRSFEGRFRVAVFRASRTAARRRLRCLRGRDLFRLAEVSGGAL